MLDSIIHSLSEEDRQMFIAFFAMPVFKRVVDENLARIQVNIWQLATSDTTQFYIAYTELKYKYDFWFSFKKLIENVEGTTDVPQIENLDL